MSEATAPDAVPVGDVPSSVPPTLPPWQPTFLAQYPRALKIGVVLGVLTVLGGVNFAMHHVAGEHKMPLPATVVTSGERQQGDPSQAHGVGQGTDDRRQPLMLADTDKNAAALNALDDTAIKLPVAPLPGLTEDNAEGSLPRISEEGQHPWRAYARPFNTTDRRPRIAIVVVDMGLSRAVTDSAINRLSGAVTFSFDAQNDVVGAWLTRARQAGHETLLQIPMEPFDYPRSDPGDGTLLTSLPTVDNLARLYRVMRRGTGYVGVTTETGSRFTTDPTKLEPVLAALKSRGLMVLDLRVAPHSVVADMASTIKLPVAVQSVRLDKDPSPVGIKQALDQLEQVASLNGAAVGVISALPAAVDMIAQWAKDLPNKGFALAPISAMTERNP